MSIQDIPQTTYILEVGYEKIYRRTYKQQIAILKNYSPSNKFHNNWKRAAFNSIAHIGRIITGMGMGALVTLMQIISSTSPIEHRIAYGLGNGVITYLISSGLLYAVIPILPANRHSEGILFIPGNARKFVPKENNTLQNKNEDISIMIRSNEFDPILDEIAETYGGRTMIQNTQKTNGGIQTIMYAFKGKGEGEGERNRGSIETQIKRFLYSLPTNVFLLSIYKVGRDVLQDNHDHKENHSDKTLLFPRKRYLKSELKDASTLTKTDEKILEYADTQLAIYNKINKNITYLVEYIKPLKFFQRLLPKAYRVPAFSPMKEE